MFCGMPMYVKNAQVFHFQYNCKQYHPQKHFKLLKLNNFWAIISQSFIHGILDDLQTQELRLPSSLSGHNGSSFSSELWIINHEARKKGLIEPDSLLSVDVEEYLV